MEQIRLTFLGVLIIFLGGFIYGCAQNTNTMVSSTETPPYVSSPSITPPPSSPVQSASVSPSQLYSTEINPISPAECGRCHIAIYNAIKEGGTKHQIDCMECHKKFHTYRPGKVEYDQILPRCGDCHQEPHGKEMVQCFECHANAHTPADIAAVDLLNKSCHNCHRKEGEEIKAEPSKHTELDCFYCHSEHGFIPECMSCHEPHTSEMTETDCLACHPAHKPLQVVYSVEAPQTTCSICHQKAYDDLQANITKHTSLTCAKCHPKHRQIPQCESCHGKPHKASIHKSYSSCGECHQIAHKLPLSEQPAL